MHNVSVLRHPPPPGGGGVRLQRQTGAPRRSLTTRAFRTVHKSSRTPKTTHKQTLETQISDKLKHIASTSAAVPHVDAQFRNTGAGARTGCRSSSRDSGSAGGAAAVAVRSPISTLHTCTAWTTTWIGPKKHCSKAHPTADAVSRTQNQVRIINYHSAGGQEASSLSECETSIQWSCGRPN